MALRRPGSQGRSKRPSRVERSSSPSEEGRVDVRGNMEDEVAVREHVKVPLLLLIDIKEEITEAVQITPLRPVENRTAEQSVDVLSQQCHEDIAEVAQLAPQELP